MKANEAPEKIYLTKNLLGVLRDGWDAQPSEVFTNIEYTRTDAFIEKACEWIETNMDDYIHVEYDTVTGKPTNEAHIAHKRVVDDFRKYMKGE